MTVLDAVQTAVVRAGAGIGCGSGTGGAGVRGVPAADGMPEYAARFADLLAQSRQTESAFTSQDAAVLGSRRRRQQGWWPLRHPGGLLGLSPGQLAERRKRAGACPQPRRGR